MSITSAFDSSQLHAIAGGIKSAERNSHPSCHAGDDLLQSKGYSRPSHAKGDRQAGEPIAKNSYYDAERNQISQKSNKLPDPVSGIRAGDISGNRMLRHATQCIDDSHSDQCSNKLSQRRVKEPAFDLLFHSSLLGFSHDCTGVLGGDEGSARKIGNGEHRAGLVWI